MKLIFGSKKRGKLLIKLFLLSVLVYAVSLLVSQQMLISGKQKKINEMKSQLSSQEVKIENLKSEIDAIQALDSDYLESVAHKDLNLSKNGERIFANVKGN